MGAIESAIAESEHWFAGEAATFRYDVTEADGVTAQVMTGWALTWELKTSRTGTVLLTKTVGDGVTIGNGSGTDDRASVAVDAEDTEAIAAGIYHQQLRRTDAGSEKVLSFGDAHLLSAGLSAS